MATTAAPNIFQQVSVSQGRDAGSGRASWGFSFLLCILGAYLNLAAYGFQYPKGDDYDVLLPLLNWLRNPSLYPSDPIRQIFLRFPSFFWLVVSRLSEHFSTEHILFALFVLTKLFFFLGVGRLVAVAVRDKVLGALIVSVIALSPFLNSTTPIGVAKVLANTSEHGMLAIAMLVLVGAFLVEGRWWSAVILGGLTVYVDALPFLHTLFAFAIFALLDWRERKGNVVGGALLGMAISIPWVFLSLHALAVVFPQDYLQKLWMFFPGGLTLRWVPLTDLVKTTAILLAMLCMGRMASKTGLKRERRLEMLTSSYFIPLFIGVLVGNVYLVPGLVRLQFLRADSFFLPYAMLLIQIYGANLLCVRDERRSATTFLLGLSAILLPLSVRLVTPFFFLVLILWADPGVRFDRVCRKFGGSLVNRFLSNARPRLAVLVCGLALAATLASLVRAPSRLWNFRLPMQPEEAACYDLQQWAQGHTPVEARFLMPQIGCGFRSFSQRSSWGEWMDGVISVHYPPFADEFVKRMAEFGFRPGPVWQRGQGADFMKANYKKQSWDHLQEIATNNGLDYIVQFRDIQYPVVPIFENSTYAVYQVRP